MTTQATTGVMRLNAATVAQYVSSRRGLADKGAQVVLLRALPVWDGPAQISFESADSGPRVAAVAAAPSPLAAYELTLRHFAHDRPADEPPLLVLLTDREEHELGADLLAQVYRQRVNVVDAWDVVRAAFGAGATDNRLFDENWAAEALLDAAPPGGWPRLGGGMLSRRGALNALSLRRLGIGRYAPDPDAGRPPTGGDSLDANALLRWSMTPGGPERFTALRAPEREGLARFLAETEQAGPTGQALIALVAAGHGADAVAFGLVCGALWLHATDAGAGQEIYRARGRAESFFGDEVPVRGEAFDALMCAFGRAAEEFVRGLLLAGRSGPAEAAAAARHPAMAALTRAASLVRQFGAESAAALSPVLAAGVEERFGAVGRALAAGATQALAAAVDALDGHVLAPDPDVAVRIERARMAQRLARWLAPDPSADAPTVAAGVERHIAETGWVDLALEHVQAGGDPDPVLAAAYDRLCLSVRGRRHAIDREFARTLATWTAAGTDPGAMLTVESFLARVVAPVVKSGDRRVLLILLDGMSAPIAAELADQLRLNWVEYDPVPGTTDTPRRRGMAAALPTITAVSRTSLFAGRIMTGTQADEKALFPAHRFWGGRPAQVFHKDDLRAGPGDPFGRDLAHALAGDTHVAVVLNTIDDRLANESKLGDATWHVADVGALADLLRAAADQGRAVILTSDHGHVIDRFGERVDAEQALSARHRAPAEALNDSEVLLSGPRVASPETGNRIVALWDADSRYSNRKAGYHGGASPAEFTIPVLAFLPVGAEPPKGWRELGDPHPAWWSSVTTDAAARGPVPEPTRTGRKTGRRQAQQVVEGQGALLDVPTAPVAAPMVDDSQHPLVSALLASEMFQAQCGLLARRPDLRKIEAALVTLLAENGRLSVSALAQRIGQRATAAEGFASVLQQILNFDGVQVLRTLPDGRMLDLNVELLREQFELV